MKKQGKTETILVLHNIRSAHNVGSVFRSADAAGVSKIFLTGYTSQPIDRFGRWRKDIAKVALGAEHSVSWESEKNIIGCLATLSKSGFTTVAVEQCMGAVDYRTHVPKRKVVYIFGNEVRGLSKRVCDTADMVIEIPMHGDKESLNVAVAVGIVLFCS